MTDLEGIMFAERAVIAPVLVGERGTEFPKGGMASRRPKMDGERGRKGGVVDVEIVRLESRDVDVWARGAVKQVGKAESSGQKKNGMA